LNRRLALLLFALVAVTLAASLALRERSRSAAARPSETWGWWNLAVGDADPRSDQELARLLSLPYTAGGARATGTRFGVRAWERERAQPGWNLYVSGHAPEAVLLAMDGRVLHRWRIAFAEAFPGRAPGSESGFFRRAALLTDGSLLALFQGTGLVKLDRASRLVWRHEAALFNDLWVSAQEDRILVLAKAARRRPDLRAEGPLLEDALVELDGEGRARSSASLLDALERSSWRALMLPLGPSADAFHSNTIEVLGGPGAGDSGPFTRGNLLVSWREIDTVATLDPDARSVLWARRGPFRGQHEPSLEADGSLLLFDNRGGEGGAARVLRFDPASGAVLWQWPGPPGRPLRSRQAGAVHRLGNGDLLVIESERGAAFELDADGGVVWEFASPHRAGERRELVATLFDVVRLEAETPFLAALDPAQAP
jgi:hypothetical protein